MRRPSGEQEGAGGAKNERIEEEKESRKVRSDKSHTNCLFWGNWLSEKLNTSNTVLL